MADNGITIEDFPENFKEVAEIIGVENSLELSKRFAGTSLYIPKMDNLYRKECDYKIRQAFTGANIPELCQRFGLTQVQIRNILSIRIGTIEDYIEKEDDDENAAK